MSNNKRDKEGIKLVMSTNVKVLDMSKKEGAWAMSENERDKEGIKHVMSTNVRV